MESISIRQCSVADMQSAPNLATLLAEYASESEIAGLGGPNAQIEAYCQMEAIGVLHLLGAFQGDDLVGFLIMIISVLPHYGARIGSTESYFVASTARKSGAGLRLLREAERLAKSLGATGFFVSAPTGSKLAEVLDSHKPYRETNRVFFRVLE